jgi:glycosyltransferase involved in cell wall biosynthesis
MKCECTLVIPCYNEALRLRPAQFLSFARANRQNRYLFVDDGSTDATRAIVTSIADQLPNQVDVLGLPRNVGKGEAVRQGVLSRAVQQSEFFGYWDADLAAPLSAANLLLERMRSDSCLEAAIGSRFRHLGSRILRSPVRHCIGRIMATAVSLSLRIPVYDTQCGAKLFRNSPRVIELFQTPFVSRWLFDVELLSRLLPYGDEDYSGRVAEVSLPEWSDVPGSKVTITAGIRSLFELMMIVKMRGLDATPRFHVRSLAYSEPRVTSGDIA